MNYPRGIIDISWFTEIRPAHFRRIDSSIPSITIIFIICEPPLLIMDKEILLNAYRLMYTAGAMAKTYEALVLACPVKGMA